MPIGVVSEVEVCFAVLLFDVFEKGGKTIVIKPIVAIKDAEIDAGGKL
jgi:hypothetical protein